MPNFARDNYHQLLAYRNEGLRKFGARFTDEIERPKARCFYPTVWNGSQATACPSVSVGPWRIGGSGPTAILAHETIRHLRSVNVLDIGCAKGQLRDYLRLRDPGSNIDYVGVDVAPADVDFHVYTDLSEVTEQVFDLIVMSEVAEHMPADVFIEQYLSRFPALLSPQGSVIVSVPNPLAPTILWRDITHVQHYPWYDLYAILRFFFDDVDVLRTHFVHSPRRVLSFPALRVLSYLLELDWCEGLALTARSPRRPEGGAAAADSPLDRRSTSHAQ